MLDQSFSPENFRKIFDLANRKGNFVEAKYFPQLQKHTDRIRSSTADIRALRKIRTTLAPADYRSQMQALYQERDQHKEKKEQVLTDALKKLSEEVSSGKKNVDILMSTAPSRTKVFTVKDTPESFFLLKQLQHNINRLYGVRQANRFEILCQLKSLLSDDFPKVLVRTDISAFYESIPTKRLLAHIDNEPLLSVSSKRVVHRIIRQYLTLSGSKTGIPRGIGISAYLAELYTRQLDQKIRSDADCFYYARYVDDIVVLYLRHKHTNPGLHVLKVKNIANELGLSLNMQKTASLSLPDKSLPKFSYLGFQITPHRKCAQFEFTASKMKKINRRIFRTFEEYEKHVNLDEKAARKLLVKRIRFLTGNTRLLNNKKNALVGIFFSNRLLNQFDCLKALDSHLGYRIGLLPNPAARRRLSNMSFLEGYTQVRFAPYSSESLKRIVQAWKHES